jgi:predicted nucleotidyltransferase
MNKTVQDLDSYSYDEIIKIINDFIIDKIWDNGYSSADIKLNDIRLHGSRLRNQAKSTSDLDAVVEYDGDIREDDFFNILNDDPLYIDDIRVDINPIKEDLNLYMKRSADYDRRKLGLEYRLRKLEQLIYKN